jgi:tRNA-dihydrouridine synthase B
MNYLGEGIDPDGQFLHQIRRVTTQADFFRVCEKHLNHEQPLPLEPVSFGGEGADNPVGARG